MDLSNIKKKAKNDEYIGARVPAELKAATEALCEDLNTSVSALLTEVMTQLLKEKGYLKNS